MVEYLSSSYQRKKRSHRRYGDQDFQFGFRDSGEEELLDFLDFSLYTLSNLGALDDQERVDLRDGAEFLRYVFSDGGSEWSIVNTGGVWGIEKRVPEEVVAAFSVVHAEDGSGYFSKAWSQCFGRNPDYSSAYLNVVRAIEADICPLVTPNDSKPTLGKVLSTFRSQSGTWSLPFTGDVPQGGGETIAAGELAVEGMVKSLEAIWHSHHDRHGKRAPEPITQEMAETAVFAALPVIQSIHNRRLVRKTP